MDLGLTSPSDASATGSSVCVHTPSSGLLSRTNDAQTAANKVICGECKYSACRDSDRGRGSVRDSNRDRGRDECVLPDSIE